MLGGAKGRQGAPGARMHLLVCCVSLWQACVGRTACDRRSLCSSIVSMPGVRGCCKCLQDATQSCCVCRQQTSACSCPCCLTLCLMPLALPAACPLQLLTSMQSSIAGELRSCLLDSLSQSQNASASASISMSEDELASQLATAIAAARKERAAATADGLEEAIAAGQLAAWAFKAAVGVGALQLVKSGAGMGLERVSCWSSN